MLHKYARDFLVFLATVDPFTTLAVFIAVTAKRSAEERKKIANRAILFATGVLIGSIAIGQIVLTAMHISLSAFQIAGGLILFAFGVQMVFGTVHAPGDDEGGDVAVFPLATPTIAGAGAILAAIMLTDNDQYAIDIQVGSSVVLLAVLFLNYLAMRLSAFLHRIIGSGGSAILERVMGLILASLAVETVMRGIAIAVGAPPPH